jgi:hypothetical protein
MSPSNLGIVFGPNLLRTAKGNDSFDSLVDNEHQVRAIELMIENAQDIFRPQDIDSAEECACAEMGLSLGHSADKKIGPAHSQEGSHDTGAMAAGQPNLE